MLHYCSRLHLVLCNTTHCLWNTLKIPNRLFKYGSIRHFAVKSSSLLITVKIKMKIEASHTVILSKINVSWHQTWGISFVEHSHLVILDVTLKACGPNRLALERPSSSKRHSSPWARPFISSISWRLYCPVDRDLWPSTPVCGSSLG